MVDIGYVSGANTATPSAINSSAHIVGTTYVDANAHGFYWDGSNNTDLYSSEPSATITGAQSINDGDQVLVANYVSGATAAEIGILQSGSTLGGLTEIAGISPDGYISGVGINNDGQVTGWATYEDGVYTAFLWQNGGLVTLPGFGPENSFFAQSIGSDGALAGYGSRFPFSSLLLNTGITWVPSTSNGTSGTFTEAGACPGFSWTRFSSVNSQHIAVGYGGYIADGSQRAVAFVNGSVVDLNDYLPFGSGWVLQNAVAINDNNQILVNGTCNGVQSACTVTFDLLPSQPVAVGRIIVSGAGGQTEFPSATAGFGPGMIGAGAVMLSGPAVASSANQPLGPGEYVAISQNLGDPLTISGNSVCQINGQTYVYIPVGQASAEFSVTAPLNAQADEQGTISADLGNGSQSCAVGVSPNITAGIPTVDGGYCLCSNIRAGNSGAFRFDLNEPSISNVPSWAGLSAPLGTYITVSSPSPTISFTSMPGDDPVITAPDGTTYVVVAPGDNSGQFHILTTSATPVGQVEIDLSNGQVSQPEYVNIESAPLTWAITINPTSVVGGNSASATVSGTLVQDWTPPSWGTVQGAYVKIIPTTSTVTVTSHTGDDPVVTGPDGAAYVVVAPQATSATFHLDTQVVSTATSVTVDATYNNVDASGSLAVSPLQVASLTANLSTVVTGGTGELTLTLNGPAVASTPPSNISTGAEPTPAPGTYVPVAVTPPSAAYVYDGQGGDNPVYVNNQYLAYVYFAPGATQATVHFATMGTVSSNSTVGFDASLNGADATASVTVEPISVQSIALSAASVPPGAYITCTVTLNGPAPYGQPPSGVTFGNSTTLPNGAYVQLGYSQPRVNFVSGPDTVEEALDANYTQYLVVQPGNTTATCNMYVSGVDTDMTDTISASYNSGLATAALSVVAPHISGMTVTPTAVQAGNSAAVTITLDSPAANAPFPSWAMNPAWGGGELVPLSSSSSAATFFSNSAQSDAQIYTDPNGVPYVFFVAGTTSATVHVATSAVTAVTQATLTAQKNGTSGSANLEIDPGPPTITTTATLSGPLGKNGWYTGPVTVTLAGTSTPYALAATYYTVDSGAQQTYSQPFTVSGDGGHTITYWSTDTAGNTETTNTQAINIDATAPVTTEKTSAATNSAASEYGPFSVQLTATDNLSGVAATYYTLDGGAQQTYTAPFYLSGNGTHTLAYWSVDVAGNVEAQNTKSIIVQATPPTTSATLSGPNGANGWYLGPVTVTLSATDVAGPSAIAATYYTVDGGAQETYSQPFTVTGEAAHKITFWSVDVAGNAEMPNAQPIDIDGTAPTLTFGTPSPAPNAAGWNNSPVSVPYTAADATSGVATALPASPATISAEGTNQSVNVTVTDTAGNTQTFTSPSVNIDLTAPVTTASASGIQGPNGAYTGSAMVTLSATDNRSGVASTYYTIDGGAQQTYSAAFTVSGGTAHTVTYWSADVAGNIENSRTLSLSFDSSAPTTTMSLAGTAGSNGWYKSAVTVTLTATDPDGASDVASTYYTVDGGAQQTYSAPFTVSGDAVHTLTFWSVDKAGNVEAANSRSVKIDATTPTVSFGTPSPAPNTAGWNNSAVSIPYTANDATSGLASVLPASPVSITTEGAGQTAVVTATDLAGNVLNASSPTVNIDLTPPSTTATPSGTQAPNGAYTGAITITLAAADNLSGVDSTYYTVDGGARQTYSSAFTVTGGSNHTVQYWSADKAGNVEATKTLSVRIDSTAPTTTASLAGTAGSNGWYKSAVTVTLTATDPDGASDVASTYYTVDGGAQQTYSAPFTLAQDGAHSIQYWSVDKAGNSESTKSQEVNIDATKPTINYSVTPSPNAAGWNNTAVSISYTATDATSGLESASPASPITISAGNGTGLTQTITATDYAGNIASVTPAGINIDVTKPVTNASVSGAQVTLSATDNLSGVASTYYTVDGGARQMYTSPFNVTSGTHTLTYWSVDVAGNVETINSTTVTTNPAPSVASMSPSSAYAGGSGFTLTVNGSNFIGSSTVTWNGASLATTFVSSTQLTAAVPASDIAATGTETVAVVTPAPGGGTSSGLTFTVNPNPMPSISSISPSTLTAGTGAFTLTVNGAGFLTSSVVNANGTALPTSYISSTQLTASVPASTIASAGSVTITVANPAPGGGASGAVTLTVAPVTIASLTLNPTTVVYGSKSNGTVTLTGPAPSGGFVVSLSSNSSRAALSTQSLTIQPGATSGSFTVSTYKVKSNTIATITASDGTTSKTATLTITR